MSIALETTAEGVVIVDPAKYKWRACVGGILGFAFDGVDFLVLALAMPYLLKEWHITMVQGGTIATATLLGACFAGYVWGPIADRWGRKTALNACLLFFGLMTALSGFAQNYIQLSIIRFVAGIGLGGEWALGGTMVSEFFPPEQRAKATGYVQLGWPLGYCLVLALHAWLVPVYGWRALFFCGISSLLAVAYIHFFVPESPVWLRAQENKRLGIKVESQTASQAVTWIELFKGSNLKVTLLCMFLCGSALTTYWGQGMWVPTFLAKERGLNLKELTGFLVGANVAGALSYPAFGWIADRFGRRWSMGLGSILSGITLVVWLNMTDATTFYWMGMIFAFAMGYWGVMAAFCAEQFPTNVRAMGVSFSYSTGRLMAVGFPMLLGAIAMKATLGFAMTVLAVIFFFGGVIAFLMKETKSLKMLS